VPKYIYVDTSSLVRMALIDHDGAHLLNAFDQYLSIGTLAVSSKLLELESARTAIRLISEGRDGSKVTDFVKNIAYLPLDDDVWKVALAIAPPVKSLDAIHLATCTLVPDCVLLTSDANMRKVAPALGITLAV